MTARGAAAAVAALVATQQRASGWCTAPAGARPKHEDCRAEMCGCECHEGGGDAD